MYDNSEGSEPVEESVSEGGDNSELDNTREILAQNIRAIDKCRKLVNKKTAKQADEMLKRSVHKCPPASVGDSVQVPVPDVDRGPLDPNHLIMCVVEIDKKKSLYKVGNSSGVLNVLLSVNGFGVCKQKFFDLDDINLSKHISLREMVRLESSGNGQGFVKCSCTGKCLNCKCAKAEQLCNSRCHGRESNKVCTRHL